VANQLLQLSTVELNKDPGAADPHMIPSCTYVLLPVAALTKCGIPLDSGADEPLSLSPSRALLTKPQRLMTGDAMRSFE